MLSERFAFKIIVQIKLEGFLLPPSWSKKSFTVKIIFTQDVDIFKKLLRCNALFYDLRKLINDFRKLIYVQRKLIYANR